MPDQLKTTPSIAEFRKNLDDYLSAAEVGEQFQIHRGITAIGILGPKSKMPAKYAEKVQRCSFTDIRDKMTNITAAMLRGRAIVVTKLVRGPNTLPKRGRRVHKIAQDHRDIAAIWPLPQTAVLAEVLAEIRRLADEQNEMREAILDLMSIVKPKLIELANLNEEINERRAEINNLDATKRRLMASPGS